MPCQRLKTDGKKKEESIIEEANDCQITIKVCFKE
jgi:hypothetical protein